MKTNRITYRLAVVLFVAMFFGLSLAIVPRFSAQTPPEEWGSAGESRPLAVTDRLAESAEKGAVSAAWGRENTLVAHDGKSIPFYIIKFNKTGGFETETDRKLAERIIQESKDYSDLFLFSHGWNNGWVEATTRYANFFEQYNKLSKEKTKVAAEGFRPLMIGVFWPSLALPRDEDLGPRGVVYPPIRGENTLSINTGAGTGVSDDDQQERYDAASLLEGEERERFWALTEKSLLSLEEATELAELIAPILSGGDQDDELAPEGGEITAASLLMNWRASAGAASAPTGPPGRPEMRTHGVPGPSENGAMGLPSWTDVREALDPRWIYRAFTFWEMRKRAGVVGRHEVSHLLQGLLRESGARIHLAGHSYGAKVVLSALNNTQGRNVHSVLLLQPALSQTAFDKTVKGGKRGAYFGLLQRVNAPLLATYSEHDGPLHAIFHRVMPHNQGEVDDLPREGLEALSLFPRKNPPKNPPKYAALGGYGPSHAKDAPRAKELPIPAVDEPYPWEKGVQVYGLDGKKRTINGQETKPISGHGDIINPFTAWALYNLVNYRETDSR